MTVLATGANAPLSTAAVSLTIEVVGASADMTALQLYSDGKVRGDGDICFFNQPTIGGGAVALPTSDARSTFDVDTSKIGADVEKVVFTASLEGTTFGAVSGMNIVSSDSHEPAVDTAGSGAALATQVGVESAALEPAPQPVSLSKVTLTKPGEGSRISLEKGAGGVVTVTATWIDNGHDRDGNDDLDLRTGILLPHGSMHWLAASHLGALDRHPFARHLGDVTSATAGTPQEPKPTKLRPISPANWVTPWAWSFLSTTQYSNGNAISNGAVSIASLQPEMRIAHQGKAVSCAYKFSDEDVARGVYTDVIGSAFFDGDDLEVSLSGATSPKRSEAIPWIEHAGKDLKVSFDGTPICK